MAAKTGRQWLHRRTVAAAHVSHAALCTNFCNSPICMPSHARFPFLPHGRLVHLPYSPASVPPASSVSGFLSARGRGDDERGVDFARCIPRANPVFAEWTRVRRKGVARAQSRKPEEPTAVWRPAVDGFLTITREGQGGGGGEAFPISLFRHLVLLPLNVPLSLSLPRLVALSPCTWTRSPQHRSRRSSVLIPPHTIPPPALPAGSPRFP